MEASVRLWDIRTWPPLYRVGLLWIIVVIAVSVKTLIDPVSHQTYPDFEYGARSWWAGEEMYEEDSGYRYGPAFAVAFGPLAALSTRVGELLWHWLNIGFFFWTMRQLTRRLLPAGGTLPRRGLVPSTPRQSPSEKRFCEVPVPCLTESRGVWTPRREALFLALVLLASVRTIWAGQSNLLVFSLVALASIAILDQRWWTAALLLAIPVHIKVWPVAAAGLLIACRPRKLAAPFATALVAVGLVPFLTGSPQWVWRQYEGWFSLLVGPAQTRHDYRDAWTLWEVVRPPVNPTIYAAIQLAAACAVLLLCLWQARRTLDTRRLLIFVLVMWTTWQLIFGPGTERNTFALIAPLTSWGLIVSFEEKRGQLLMGLSFLLTAGASFGVFERWLQPCFPGVLAVHPVGIAIFFAWFLTFNGIVAFPSTEESVPSEPVL